MACRSVKERRNYTNRRDHHEYATSHCRYPVPLPA